MRDAHGRDGRTGTYSGAGTLEERLADDRVRDGLEKLFLRLIHDGVHAVVEGMPPAMQATRISERLQEIERRSPGLTDRNASHFASLYAAMGAAFQAGVEGARARRGLDPAPGLEPSSIIGDPAGAELPPREAWAKVVARRIISNLEEVARLGGEVEDFSADDRLQ